MSERLQGVFRWRVTAMAGEVADILADTASLPRWWPSVYRRADEVTPADEQGTGHRVRFVTAGRLPGTMTWESVVVEARYPDGVTLDLSGDLAGRVVWTLQQDGPEVEITSDWSFRVETPLARRAGPWLRRLLLAEHRWAMEQGRLSLALELQRRRTTELADYAAIAPPPGPVTYAAAALVGGAAVIGGTLALLMLRASRRRSRRRR